jgi:ribonuclease-3
LSWPRLGRDRPRPAAPGPDAGSASLAGLIDALPEDLRTCALTHSSWANERIGSYERLALLGDSVLGLSIADELYRTLPGLDAGSLTKILNQAVSGTSCAAVGRELGIPDMLIAADPGGPEGTQTPARLLLEGERPLPEITEAMIGACFLEFGFERTARAVVGAFRSRIETVQSTRTDFKSALQESVARSGGVVEYEVVDARGPAHQRIYEVVVKLHGEEIGRGEGRSKKAAGQAAAARALESLDA